MKKIIYTLLVSLFGAITATAQTTPQGKTRTDGSYTQIDYYLNIIKRLGIPTSNTDVLDASTASANTAKIIWNTSLNKLRVWDGIQWRDAIQADLSPFYNKQQVDSLLTLKASDAELEKVKNDLEGQLLTKVDKIEGKGLSTEDYTAAEKNKLAGLADVATSGNYNDLMNKPVETDQVFLSQKGVANGVATLGGSGKIPTSQLPDELLGSVSYQGNYDASTNSPVLPAASGNKGKYYVISTAGTQQGLNFETGDWIISNGTVWEKVDNNNKVTSVAGKVGAVSLNKTDVGLSNVDNTGDLNKPVSTATQTALDGKANDANVVHKTGDETIAGVKNFTSVINQGGQRTVYNNASLNSIVIGDGGQNFHSEYGVNNTAIGRGAMFSMGIGGKNSSLGYRAMYSNTDGNYNTAVGYRALSSSLSSSYNTAIGANAGVNTTGSFNTLIGGSYSSTVTTGVMNVCIGGNNTSVSVLGSGSNNTLIGSLIHGISTGSNNTIIGQKLVLPSNLTNNIIIADGSGNQRINVLDNGNIGIGIPNPTAKLDVAGTGRFAGTVKGYPAVDSNDFVTKSQLNITADSSLLNTKANKTDVLQKAGDVATGLLNYDNDKSATYMDRSLIDNGYFKANIQAILSRNILKTRDIKKSFVSVGKLSRTDTLIMAVENRTKWALNTQPDANWYDLRKFSFTGLLHTNTVSDGGSEFPDSIKVQIGLYIPPSKGYFSINYSSAKSEIAVLYEHIITKNHIAPITGGNYFPIEIETAWSMSGQNVTSTSYPDYTKLTKLSTVLRKYRNGQFISSFPLGARFLSDKYPGNNFPLHSADVGYVVLRTYYFADSTNSKGKNQGFSSVPSVEGAAILQEF